MQNGPLKTCPFEIFVTIDIIDKRILTNYDVLHHDNNNYINIFYVSAV